MKLYLCLALSLWCGSATAQTNTNDATINTVNTVVATSPNVFMTIGNIDSFIINQTRYDDLLSWYKHFFLKDYDQGEIYVTNWPDGKPPLRWNCYAKVIDNPKENLTTDAGRNNRAKFVPGYHMIVEHGIDLPFKLNNIQLLFDNEGLLINLKADVGIAFDKVVTYYCGAPRSVVTKSAIKSWQNDSKFKIPLNTTIYTWTKSSIKAEVIIADKLNDRGDKKTTSITYQMTDTIKYNAYLQQVAAEKKRLDMAYAGVKGQ